MNNCLKGKSDGRSMVVAAALCSLVLPIASLAGQAPAPLQTVDRVDLDRYLGNWYEIARYPAWFQKGCTGATAEYSLLPAGLVRTPQPAH